ncbi:biotin--[acetyl-CoA-carboxylase] ligase [Helicobacter apodemus]|uniref:Biotin--[acetyl-CoA-carboxylase] ligase n=1 Tax=Helicobacter apodemus TaxID=135569 RepID=A0A4U8UEP4_9HELI|nr:biotin--[acetyl-CoA-carboxylase] ligase [Helicobacter apodemus]TLE14824.1 biotin--[acetyl-CoA-carboxylase] ligase [Helicobacter apodemus]
MKILFFECLESTHLFLVKKLKDNTLKPPIMVVAHHQNKGIGSRGNVWEAAKEGLYFSFALYKDSLPQDLPLESTSIFYGYIFKSILEEHRSKVWLKWPNDLYIQDKKIGGVLCTLIEDKILVGIGLNLKVENKNFGALDIQISRKDILEKFIEKTEVFKWKQIFSKYKLEFPNNFHFNFHHKGRILSLKNASLFEDGSILLDGQRIYSLR